MSDPITDPTELAVLAEFEAVCRQDAAQTDPDLKIDAAEELDWRGLSMGFFLAKGLTVEASSRLSSHARYELQYWQ